MRLGEAARHLLRAGEEFLWDFIFTSQTSLRPVQPNAKFETAFVMFTFRTLALFHEYQRLCSNALKTTTSSGPLPAHQN
jgi:hypothetical protein